MCEIFPRNSPPLFHINFILCNHSYELLSPEQRREEEAAAAEAVRRSFLLKNNSDRGKQHLNSTDVAPRMSSALPPSARYQTFGSMMWCGICVDAIAFIIRYDFSCCSCCATRREVSPTRTQVAAFVEPHKKEPVEVSLALTHPRASYKLSLAYMFPVQHGPLSHLQINQRGGFPEPFKPSAVR